MPTTTRCVVNDAVDPAAVPAPTTEATAFHAALPGYRPTPVRDLPAVAAAHGLAPVAMKDESHRLGLPAFKVLGASWAIERALRAGGRVHTLVAASAGNHGRAVAHVAAGRGLRCRVFLPARSAAARRAAIEAAAAEVVVVDGDYDDALAAATAAARETGTVEIADAGRGGPATWVIDGYATLFAEIGAEADPDVILVPVGVGSLAAAAARFAAARGAHVVGVEPATAACLSASLAAGRRTRVPTPGTTMAGLDCADVSTAAWPTLRTGIRGTVTVGDAEVAGAVRELAAAGFVIGECGAAPLAALHALVSAEECAPLRSALGLHAGTRILLVATEGPTDPATYRAAVA